MICEDNVVEGASLRECLSSYLSLQKRNLPQAKVVLRRRVVRNRRFGRERGACLWRLAWRLLIGWACVRSADAKMCIRNTASNTASSGWRKGDEEDGLAERTSQRGQPLSLLHRSNAKPHRNRFLHFDEQRQCTQTKEQQTRPDCTRTFGCKCLSQRASQQCFNINSARRARKPRRCDDSNAHAFVVHYYNHLLNAFSLSRQSRPPLKVTRRWQSGAPCGKPVYTT